MRSGIGGGDGDTTESESDDADDEVEEEESVLVNWMQQAENVPRVQEGTSRLAVVNCDWDQLRAVDLLAVLRSFLPAGGSIRRVTVYPSEHGEKMMRAEAAAGPAGIWERPAGGGGGGGGSDDDSDDASDDGGGDGGAVDNERLRRYELERCTLLSLWSNATRCGRRRRCMRSVTAQSSRAQRWR